jgi:20S proteasome alpha/beta subunit
MTDIALTNQIHDEYIIDPGSRYADDMELEDAIHTALLTLKEGFEGQIAADNIEVRSRCVCVKTHL